MSHLPQLITIPSAARKAGIGVRHLRKATARGEITIFQIGAWPRVRLPDVLDWIERQRAPRTPHAEKRLAEVLGREKVKARKLAS